MVNRWKDLSASCRIASKLAGHELPGWFLLTPQGLAKKPFSRSTITVVAQQNIDHVSILIRRSEEVVELAADLDEDLVDEPEVTEPSLFPPKISSIGGTEIRAAVPNGFLRDGIPRSASRPSTSRKPNVKR